MLLISKNAELNVNVTNITAHFRNRYVAHMHEQVGRYLYSLPRSILSCVKQECHDLYTNIGFAYLLLLVLNLLKQCSVVFLSQRVLCL